MAIKVVRRALLHAVSKSHPDAWILGGVRAPDPDKDDRYYTKVLRTRHKHRHLWATFLDTDRGFQEAQSLKANLNKVRQVVKSPPQPITSSCPGSSS